MNIGLQRLGADIVVVPEGAETRVETALLTGKPFQVWMPDSLLDRLGLSAKAGVYPKQLSAGEQKRATIARSLITRPRIILADEPTADLDEQTEREVITLLKDVHLSGATILMVTHAVELICHATSAFSMKAGSLLSLSV